MLGAILQITSASRQTCAFRRGRLRRHRRHHLSDSTRESDTRWTWAWYRTSCLAGKCGENVIRKSNVTGHYSCNPHHRPTIPFHHHQRRNHGPPPTRIRVCRVLGQVGSVLANSIKRHEAECPSTWTWASGTKARTEEHCLPARTEGARL